MDEEENAVRQLGELFGYGRVMQFASEIWSKKDPNGALTVGPCRAMVSRENRLDDRLTRQLRRSIELNARMVTRLQAKARLLSSEADPAMRDLAEDLLQISHDKDPD
jgi:hypothetical protein